jgi:hypothetical protein
MFAVADLPSFPAAVLTGRPLYQREPTHGEGKRTPRNTEPHPGCHGPQLLTRGLRHPRFSTARNVKRLMAGSVLKKSRPQNQAGEASDGWKLQAIWRALDRGLLSNISAVISCALKRKTYTGSSITPGTRQDAC